MSKEGKPITCRAAVNEGPNEPFVIHEVQVAPPKAGEVRIKMVSTGICHSDLHFQEGLMEGYPFPTILGHEGAGIIESVGSGVTSVKPGDSVVLLFEAYCGECFSCANPKTNLCQKQTRDGWQIDGTSRITRKGQPLSQLCTISTFSEYTVTHEMNVTKVNPKAPMNKLCLAGCCIPTGYGAVMKRAQVPAGATCAVWGLGGVGMNVIMACKESKASKVIGVDVNPAKFDLAKELGCTDVLNPKDYAEGVKPILEKMTNGGVDYCFVSVGNTNAMEEAFNCSHPMWGETIIIGITELDATVSVGVWSFLYGRQIKGTYYGSYKNKLEIPKIVDKIVAGKIPLDKLISHVLPFEDIDQGFELLKSGKSIRTVIDFELKKKCT